MAKLFVWDFHGVLETGNEKAVLEISNIILEKFGYKERFTYEQIDKKFYGEKWFEYFKKLLPDESHKKHLELQNECIEHSLSHPEIVAKYIKPTKYAHEVLERIAEEHFQILISNCEPLGVKMFLESVNMTKYFSNKNTFAVNSHQKGIMTKRDALKQFLEGKKFDKFVFIGDSPQDVELKNEFGGTSYLYAHPERGFRECEADYKIRDLRDILVNEGFYLRFC